LREETVLDGEGCAQGAFVVPDIDRDEEVVHVHLPHVLARHYHRVLLLRLLQAT